MRSAPRLVLLVVFGLAVTAGGLSRPVAGQAPLSLSGTVWQDDNADGVRQPQEQAIALAEIRLTGPAGELPSTKTDSDGRYSFTGLSAGSYELSLGPYPESMWAQTAPTREGYPPRLVSLTLGGDQAQTIDFGLFPLGGIPQFSGSAWVNAEPVPKPEVRAFVGNVDCTLPVLLFPVDPEPVSRYLIRVAPAAFIAGCGTEGATITFTINGQRANETAIWRRVQIEQTPPGTIVTIPAPPAVAPPFANTQSLALTVGPPFAAYYGGVTDASTGQRLDTLAPRFPSVEAYVGDTLCGSVPGYGLGAYVVVPSEQLKPGCGREGAIVRFVVDGFPSPEQVVWKRGVQSLTLTLSSADVPAGVFRIVISAEALHTPVSRTATGFDTLGQALGTLTVLGDGKPCTQVDVSAPQGDIVIELGRPGQPAECTHEGATITFIDGRGRELNTRMTLTKGTQQRLDNLAPVPPSSGGGPEPAQSGRITPPDTGDAGLAQD